MRKSCEIAKLFDLALYQEFKMSLWEDTVFRLTETTLQSRAVGQSVFRDADYVEIVAFYNDNDVRILRVKKGWKPAMGEMYSTIDLLNNCIVSAVWQDSEEDNLRFANNLVFPIGDETPNRILNKINVIIENERFEC